MEALKLVVPTRPVAERLLAEAARLNPGPWEAHSRWVAIGAETIAAHHPSLAPERAYVLGLLHDIGRRYGPKGMVHALDGYNYLMEQGYPGAAQVSLTHSYPDPSRPNGACAFDGSPEEWRAMQDSLLAVEYDDYDYLILLCDSLALPTGFCLMEKRLVDVVMRYGFNEHTLDRWNSIFAIKARIEAAIGGSVYSLLPGVVENTFG
jgi:hypothetical protein